MRDFEDLLIPMLGLLMVVIFLPGFLGAVTSNDSDQEDCVLEWVECNDTDLVGNCTIHEETIVTGPYWNETTETKVTLIKQACKKD
jgi:hypothetical protein